MSKIRRVMFAGILGAGVASLAGCVTPEVRKTPEVKTDFSFYSEKEKTPAEQTQNKTPSTKTSPPTLPETNSLTNKKMYTAPPSMTIDPTKEYTATLRTDLGDIVIRLYAQATPRTVNNFVFLAREKFYDGTIFHRTISGFMIQGGDPSGTGRGGPGYTFADEAFEGTYARGTLAMANAGPDTNGSQFFIMHKDGALPPNYTIFGTVISGMETVDKIAQAPTQPGGEGSSPVTPVRIETIIIEEK